MKNKIKKLPLSLQIFLVIIFLFISFFLLQQLINNYIFKSYYTNTQIDSIKQEIMIPYIDGLNNNTTSTTIFNENNIAHSIIYEKDEPTNIINEIFDDINFENDHNIFKIKNDKDILVCFVDKLDNLDYVITVFEIEESNQFISNLNKYNYIAYGILLIFICIASWAISKKIAKPIENITSVANNISNLDFSKKCIESSNKETYELSNSINKLNDNLKETIDKLNQKNEEANILVENQKQNFLMKKQLVSAISHELKTPLAIMQASISGIIDGVFEPEENERELQNVLKEINHTSEMVQEVLDVYRLDNESFHLEIEELDFVYFTQKIINSFETVLTNSNAKIKFFYDQKSIKIDGDYRQLKRVISNLFVNAIKYSPEYQTINVSIKLIDGYALFEVTNYGVTIPEEDIKNVFEPFYRVDKTGNRTEKRKGSGLGLYIVREILEKHQYKYGIKNIENGVCTYFYANLSK